MSTIIRPEISENNKYWIPKHRYYELKHFCLQYPDWKKLIFTLDSNLAPNSVSIDSIKSVTNIPESSVESLAMSYYMVKRNIEIVEKAVMDTDKEMSSYILKAVTEGLPYTYFEANQIPYCRDSFYDRYRKFFYLLSALRN